MPSPAPNERGVGAQLAGLRGATRCPKRLVAPRQDLGEEGQVVVDELLVVLGHATVLADRLDRADRFAGAAVDALLGVDVALAVTLIDAVDRALIDARLVVDVDAGA